MRVVLQTTYSVFINCDGYFEKGILNILRIETLTICQSDLWSYEEVVFFFSFSGKGAERIELSENMKLKEKPSLVTVHISRLYFCK